MRQGLAEHTSSVEKSITFEYYDVKIRSVLSYLLFLSGFQIYSKLKKKLTRLPILRSRDFNFLSSKLPHRQECAIGYYIRLEESSETYNQRLIAPQDFIRFIRKTAPRFEPIGYKKQFANLALGNTVPHTQDPLHACSFGSQSLLVRYIPFSLIILAVISLQSLSCRNSTKKALHRI